MSGKNAPSVSKYVELFFQIDQQRTDQITREQLLNYQVKHALEEENFAGKWLQVFDPQNSGVIHLEDMCDALGYSFEDVKRQQKKFFTLTKLPKEVEVISQDMHLAMQIKIFQLLQDIYKESSSLTIVSKKLKGKLDEALDRVWHVVIARGDYWSHFSHEPGFNFAFKYRGNIHLVWRCPLPE